MKTRLSNCGVSLAGKVLPVTGSATLSLLLGLLSQRLGRTMNPALTVCLGSSIVICDLKVQEVGMWLGKGWGGACYFAGAKSRFRKAVSERLRQARFG